MDRKHNKSSVKRPSNLSRKRTFKGNRYTSENSTDYASTSAAKLKRSNDQPFDVHVDPNTNYCVLQFSLIFTALQEILKCKKCNSEVRFSKYGQRGLGFKLCVQCSCEEDYYINSCPMIGHAFEINRRFVFAMRVIGVGIHGIKNFCGLMDLGLGLSNTTYYGIIDNIIEAVKTVFDFVTCKAAHEEKTANAEAGNPRTELTVSGDGSWAKRGFSSLLGFVSIIGKHSNKILDVIVKSSICKACEKWKGQENTHEYEAWYEDHKEKCDANHDGSAGKMEVDGILEIFGRSEKKHGAKYAYYIGDGDTKTFKTLLDAKPYGDDFVVKKQECILHVKKRMFRRAKEAKKHLTQLKKTRSADEDKKSQEKSSTSKKKLPASTAPKKVQLTNKIIKDLAEYYGLAICRNSDSVENMKRGIWATYFHKISTNEEPQHSYCPLGAESWCEWRKHQAAGTLDLYNHPPPLDDEVQMVLKPIYEDLTSEDLLDRCLGSNTQNNNESFNACVWHLAPKHVFCGKKVLEISVGIAASIFNEGFRSILTMMEIMNVQIGPEAARLAQVQDDARVRTANRRSSEASKEARMAQRTMRSDENEAFEEAEGILYGAGIAD